MGHLAGFLHHSVLVQLRWLVNLGYIDKQALLSLESGLENSQSPVSGSWFWGNPEFVRSELVETLGFPFQVAGSAQPRVSCCGNIRRGPNLLGRWLDLLWVCCL